MSTRGMIATVRGDALYGNYNHFDSYVSGLGETLLQTYRELGDDLDKLRAVAIDDHPGGWSVFPTRCYCHDRGETEHDMRRECGCGAGDYTRGCDALFAEYLYVLNSRGLDVYKSVPTGQTELNTRADGFQWHSPLYRHAFVGTLPWDADDDAIGAMQERASAIHDAVWEEHGRVTVQ